MPEAAKSHISRWTIVGGGQMGRALTSGVVQAGIFNASDLTLVEPSAAGRAWWAENLPKVSCCELPEAVAQSDAVLLAVKPGVLPAVAQQTAGFWDGKLVVSIAAGIPLPTLTAWLGHDRVIRVMPNTPSLVGCGASGFCCAAGVSETDSQIVESMLGAVGVAHQVDESQIDAVTGLSGSGPAYVYIVIEALADGGVAQGLPRAMALELATQTVLGAAQMVSQTGQHPAVLKDAVASPGGTTIKGITKLEEHGVRAGLIAAVQAATQRSIELRD